jgi:hypothetical protein
MHIETAFLYPYNKPPAMRGNQKALASSRKNFDGAWHL